MKLRERCACGAEFEVGCDGVTEAKECLEKWRSHHARVCMKFEPTIGGAHLLDPFPHMELKA